MTAADETLKLEVWPGEWDLPSVDPDCLTVMAYCKFSGIPVKVLKGNNPSKSPSGHLPILYQNGYKESSISKIFNYLHRKNWGADLEQDSKQQADIKAFTALLQEKLLPAYLHTWWVDKTAYDDTTRPCYAKACSFPRNFYLPKHIKAAATSTVYRPKSTSALSEKDIDLMIYKEAKECLNNLSYRLGDKDFFMGKRPCSLDAAVFAYLAPLLKGPLQNSQLVVHLNNTPNLCALCNRVLSRYFPISPEDQEERRKKEQERLEAMKTDALEFPNKRRNMILAGIFAVTAMLAFTLTSGIIHVEKSQQQEDYTMDEVNEIFESEGHEGDEDY